MECCREIRESNGHVDFDDILVGVQGELLFLKGRFARVLGIEDVVEFLELSSRFVSTIFS